MPLSAEQIHQLDKPINPKLVKVKPTQGSPKYLEGHEAMNAANRIFRYDGWGYVVDSIERVDAPGGVLYRALVTVSVAGCQPKQDVGTEIASNLKSGDPPAVQAHETAMKGAVTDGVKRALRSFGDQFGASLYDKGADLQGEYAAWQQSQTATDEPAAKDTPARAPMTPDAWLDATVKAKAKLAGKQPPYPAVMADWLRVHIGRGQELAPGILHTEPALMTDDVLTINLDTLEQAIVRQRSASTKQEAMA